MPCRRTGMASADLHHESETDVTQTPEPAIFQLPTTLDHDSARELADFLETSRGTPVTIDGFATAQVGAQAAQILAVAEQAWTQDRLAFRISDPSGAIAASLTRMGMMEALSHAFAAEGAVA